MHLRKLRLISKVAALILVLLILSCLVYKPFLFKIDENSFAIYMSFFITAGSFYLIRKTMGLMSSAAISFLIWPITWAILLALLISTYGS